MFQKCENVFWKIVYVFEYMLWGGEWIANFFTTKHEYRIK